jgi:hypothetical protein
VDDEPLQLGLERLGLQLVGEVAVLLTPREYCPDDPVGDLLQRPLPLRGAQGAPEVLLSEDVGGVDAPAARDLDAQLLERHGAGSPVGDARVASLPSNRLVRVRPGRREVAADADAGPLRGYSHFGVPSVGRFDLMGHPYPGRLARLQPCSR